MKKILSFILTLVLLLSVPALAETGDRLKVVNCKEFISLREEPSTSATALARIPLGKLVDEVGPAENGFTRVSWRGQTGYALSSYLSLYDDFRGSEVDVTSKQRYNLNLFLSNFTEAGFLMRGGSYDSASSDAATLTEFAINHCWFNRQNQLEWGEYFRGNNVRLSRSQIVPVVEKYFGVTLTPPKSLPYIDYKDGYYYWEETGGHTKDGFACLNRVERLSSTYYCVWFDVFARGSDWDNDVCYYTTAQAGNAFPIYGNPPAGRAIIDVGAGGLDDREGWRIDRYTLNNE